MKRSKRFFLIMMFACVFHGVVASQDDKNKKIEKLQNGIYKRLISIFKIKHGSVNITVQDGEMLLHSAVNSNKYNFVNYLLQAGANSMIKDRFGKTAHDYAHTLEMQNILQNNILIREAIDFCYNPETGKNNLYMTDEDLAGKS